MEMFRSVSTTDTRDARSRFVAEVARGLATFSAEDLRGGCLTLPFGLSAWMKRADMDVSGAIESLIVLRSALLEASGLEAQCEPVPLLGTRPEDGRDQFGGLPPRAPAARCQLRSDLEDRDRHGRVGLPVVTVVCHCGCHRRNVVGMCFTPACLLVRNRSMGPSSANSSKRASSSSSMMRISMRARLAPRQKWLR